jgi:hypothetical protein
MPVYHAPSPVSRPAPVPAQPNRTVTVGRGGFTLPLDLNLRPHRLPQTLGQPALEATPKLLPYRYSWPWGWGWSPGFLSAFPCFANSSFWGPWGLAATPTDAFATPAETSAMPGVTLGSLVDANSRNFLTTYPSYGLSSAETSAATPLTSGPTLQYGFQSGGCGPSYSFGL